MRILTIEITRTKFYFLLLLLITSCQKDYYLDDLNDALDQVNTLRSEKSQLESQLNQIQVLLNQSNNTISQLESAYNQLQTSYDNLYQDFINERSTVAELKDLIAQLANEVNALKSQNNGIEDGYYVVDRINYKRNDTIFYEYEIRRRIQVDNNFDVVQVVDGKITKDITVYPNYYFWDVENTQPMKFIDYRNPKDYTYLEKFGTYDHINEYTGDSMPYYQNYRIVNKDIFTSELRDPEENSSIKNAFYKIFTDPEEIVGNIIYEPVVQFAQNSYLNNFETFNEILDVYDFRSENEMLSDSIYSKIDQADPKSYLDAFIKDAEIYGVDLSSINVDELITDYWYTPTDQYGRENVAGWGLVNCSITNNNIGLSDPYFSSNFLTDYEWWKLLLMYHEFGHSILNLKHTCADGHIMSASSCEGEENEEFDQYRVYNSLVDFRSSVKDMFDGYNQYYYPCTAGFSSRPTIEN